MTASIGSSRVANRLVAAALLLMLGLLAAGRASACTVTGSLTANLGSYSAAAIGAGAVPAVQTPAGLTCPPSVITVLGGNYLRATFRSTNGLVLKQQGGAATIAYVPSADANGAYRFAQGTTIDYSQNNLVTALGLVGNSPATLPIFIRPAATASLPTGTYIDQITIDWSWYQCPGLGALGVCVGAVDTGTGRSVLSVSLAVTPKAVVMTVSTVVTADPVNGSSKPKAIPGSRSRLSMAVSNPDIVPLDNGSVALVVATPAHLVVALDGDGAGSTAFVQFTDGSPASTLTLTYTRPNDATDDVDFSNDGGATWTYAPVAGDVASEAAITHVRFRPKGTMAKSSAFTLSFCYLVG